MLDKVVDHLERRGHALRPAEAWRPAAHRSARLDHEILIVVHRPQVLDLKPVGAKEPGQRPFGEIRTVLIVDVPKGHITQHVLGIGDLKNTIAS